MTTDTIAAISTAYGKGGIAVIRISGSEATNIADRVFKPKDSRTLTSHAPRTMVYGEIYGGDSIIDDGMAYFMPSPNSFTGEDTVELSCHGGILLTKLVLEAVLSAGARHAAAGEFTRRAFTAGKLTLSQAEAVINKIDARTEEQIRLASSHARGVLSDKVASLCDRIKELAASVYVTLDFPDEDLAPIGRKEMIARSAEIERELSALAATYRAGSAVAEGIDCVIAGKPNAGKSSLLNMLLGRERAIVTETAGTTRDTIEECMQLGSVTLRLCDTAGIRPATDEVERIGVDRAKSRIASAGLLLAVFDGSSPLDSVDSEVMSLCDETKCTKIAVINKSDLGTCIDIEALRNRFGEAVCVSAARREGREALASVVDKLFETGGINYDTTAVIASARQSAAVSAAVQALGRVSNALDSGMETDIAAIDLELALGALSELDGRSVSGEIVDSIFHRFCVGK